MPTSWIATFAGLTIVLAQSAQADPPGEFDRLKGQFDEQFDADKNREAEQTAIELRRLAEGPLSGEAERLGTAIYCQGIAVYYQKERRKEAAPLLEKALAVREKTLGREDPAVADVLMYLGWIREEQGRSKEAEPLFRRALTIREKKLGSGSLKLAFSLNVLAIRVHDQGRYDEAESLYRRALAIREKTQGAEHLDVAIILNNLGCLLNNRGRNAEAEELHKRALDIREKQLGREHIDVAASLNNLAEVYRIEARYAAAEPLYKRSLAIREKVLGPDDLDVAASLNNLAILYDCQGRYADVERLYRRALAIEEKALSPEHPDVAMSLNNLATFCHDQGRYAEAEAIYKRVLAIREKVLGPEHPDVGSSLHNLASICEDLGRCAEAEALYRRALATKEKSLGSDHAAVARTLNSLANVYRQQGHYAEAESLYRRALVIQEKASKGNHPDTADTVNNLAILYKQQMRYAEAERLYRQSLAIREKVFGAEHLKVAASLNNLGTLCDSQGRSVEAETFHRRSLRIKEKVLGPSHPDVAMSLNNLALVCQSRGQYSEAETLFQRAMAISEKAFGPDHPDLATRYCNLAFLRKDQNREADAEPLIDRAITILERTRVDPDLQLKAFRLRADLAWKAGRRAEAVADLRRAMDLAEFQRGRSSGGERERAEFFGSFCGVFETMVDWQAQLGDMHEVLAAMERGRARSLLDEMNVGGTNLQVGRSALEREQLRQRETELKSRVATLARQLDPAGKRTDAEKQRLQDQLAEARESLYQHYREDRSSNPVYRNLLSVGAGSPRMSQIQRKLAVGDGLVLVYLFGRDNGYLLVVGPSDARLVKLSVDPVAAKILGVDTGPLTANRLHAILAGKRREEASSSRSGAPGRETPPKKKSGASFASAAGVLVQLADPADAKSALPKLAALWKILVPEPQRKELTGGKFQRLIVIPDGPLALLPFEALVVEPGEQPRYLLDVGPAIYYGPSATVLLNLFERSTPPGSGPREPVLTVGNPAYSAAARDLASGSTGTLGLVASRSRYRAAGGKLTQLPYSGWESSWVADAFGKGDLKSTRLEGSIATEASVRVAVGGRRIVHLACHGLADQAYGNFYGALALTPGKDPADPADDGFLTLPEIYELDLKSCELAVLSACETNYGPEQRGEGVWALSRGFLVAGARRVVASNWLVDDEAAASLVSQFCAGIARHEKDGERIQYASALRNAKLWVRQQEKWSSPYYWATFVLVGPN